MSMWVEDRMLDREELPDITKLSASTIEELVRQDDFPKPRQLSPRRIAWLASDVIEWMRSRPVSDLPPPANTGAKKPRRPAPAGPALPA